MAPRLRVALSNSYLSIEDPGRWLDSVRSALLARAEQTKQTADQASPLSAGFGLTFDMVDQQAAADIEESERLATLALFAAVEAALQIDYQNRIRRRVKQGKPLRRLFREIHKETERKNLQAPPVERLLDTWKQAHHQAAQLAGDLLAAFRYRHWLAHGRYWVFRGKTINHDLLYHLASRLFQDLDHSEAGFYPVPSQSK